MVPTPPWSTAIALDRQGGLGGGEGGVPPGVHRRGAGVRGLAAEAEQVALDPGAARDRAAAHPLRLEHRALLDVELEVGRRGPPGARGRRGRRRARRRARPGPRRSGRPPASVSEVSSSGTRVPARAELPKRLRPKRAPSSSAKSISTRSRGGVRSARRPGTQQPEPGEHAERPVEASRRRAPNRGGSRRPGPAHSRSAPGSRAQRLPASSTSTSSTPISARRSRSSRRAACHSGVQQTRRAPSGPPVSVGQVAKVGEHAGGVDRRPGVLPTGQPTRSRRSACARQWAPPPPSVNMLRSGSKTSMPRARSCSLRLFEYSLESARSSPERDRVDAERERLRDRYLEDLEPGLAQPADEAGAGHVDADRRQLRGEDREQHVDVDELARDHLDPDLPAELLHPGGELLGGGRLGSLLAVADHHPPGLDDDHVAALERAGGDHPVNRDARLLVEADHRRVLAPSPLLVELGDDRSLRRGDARIAREHLVGKGGIGLQEMAADARGLVGRDHLGVLGERRRRAEAALPGERRLRDRAGRQPAEVVRRAEQDVEQPAVLGVGPPGRSDPEPDGPAALTRSPPGSCRGSGRSAPRTCPPWASESAMKSRVARLRRSPGSTLGTPGGYAASDSAAIRPSASVEGDRLLRAQEGVARGHLRRLPGRRRRERGAAARRRRSGASSAASRRPSSRRAPVSATFSPIPKTATTTFSA